MKVVFKYDISRGTFIAVEDGGKVLLKSYEMFIRIGQKDYRFTGDSVLEVVLKAMIKAECWYKAHGVVA